MDPGIVTRFWRAINHMRPAMEFGQMFPGLRERELWVLHILSHCQREGVRATTTALSQHLGQTKSAVSQMLNTLEGRGYVSRTIDPENRRKTLIEVTAAGLEYERSCLGMMREFLSEVFERMGDRDAELFVSLMEKCFQAVGEVKEERLHGLQCACGASPGDDELPGILEEQA